MRRFLPALIWTALIVGTAPVIREVRELFFRLFPGEGVRLLGGALLLIMAGLLALALARIRTHRAWRYSGLVLVLVLLWLQIDVFSQDHLAASIRGQVNISERLHIVEYGLLAILLYRAFWPQGGWASLLLPLLWVTAAGTLDEWVQWLSPRRTGEFRDVLMNIVAGGTGVLFAVCMKPPQRSDAPWHRALRRIARTSAGVALFTGLFFYTAHLGYEIHDPEVGRFRSWFTAEQLAEIGRERTQRWDVPNPPTGQEIWALQDYYMTEGARHTQHRNQSFHDGLLVLAWHANEILERYYGAYLDKRLPNGKTHRARAPLRQAFADGNVRGNPETYRSPVLAHRIYVRPTKPVFLALLSALVAALWSLPWLLRPRSR